jgi:hypothetical protein
MRAVSGRPGWWGYAVALEWTPTYAYFFGSDRLQSAGRMNAAGLGLSVDVGPWNPDQAIGAARFRLSVGWLPYVNGLPTMVTCMLWAAPATAQVPGVGTCPSGESCGDGTCCASSDLCCPTPADGCCDEATPYCCGDGLCAVSPSACPLAAAGDASTSTCNGYDVPCGHGCAAAGSDCCDSDGRYCPPGATCTSEAICSDGTRAGLVTATQEPRVSPLGNPPDAISRSCAMARGRDALPSRLSPLCLLAVAAALASCRSRRRQNDRIVT